MNPEDSLRRRLSDAAGRIDSNPLPRRVGAMTGRVEAHRARARLATAASAGVVGLAALGVGIALVTQSPPVTPPAGPAPTLGPRPSEEPTPAPSTPAPTSAPERWSTPITPTCGDLLEPDELDTQITFTGPPETISPRDSFPVTVDNPNGWPLLTRLARYDAAVPVLTDAAGTVVAVGDLEPVLIEGHSVLALAPAERLGMSGTLRWTAPCDGDEPGGDPYDDPVPDGDYEMYLLAGTAPADGHGNQIQGGPFPVTVDSGAEHEVPQPTLQPGPGLPECGADWAAPEPGGLPGRLDPTDSPEAVAPGDDPLTTLEVTFDEAVAGADVFGMAHIVAADGTVAGPRAPAHDQSLGWYSSTAATGETTVPLDATDCAGDPLPTGDYEVYYSLHTIAGESADDTIALSGPVPVTIE